MFKVIFFEGNSLFRVQFVNFSFFQQKIIKPRTAMIKQEKEKSESGIAEDFDHKKTYRIRNRVTLQTN